MGLAICNTTTDSYGRELALHGTALFPIACYHDDLTTCPVPWHWHDELEVLVVTEGSAVVTAGSEKRILHHGDGCFINTGVLHGAWDFENSGCRFHSLVFHARLVGGSMDSIFWQNYIQPLMQNPTLKFVCFDASEFWMQEANNSIETAWENCMLETPGYEFAVRDALSHLIFLLSTHHPSVPQHTSDKALRNAERIKIMLQYVQEHYNGEISTAQIAESALISESECLRCFRATIGTTPIQYVKQFRIQKAAELLTSTNQKIADIAAQCGFFDVSYFTKTFREQKGCTPGEYRKIQ